MSSNIKWDKMLKCACSLKKKATPLDILVPCCLSILLSTSVPFLDFRSAFLGPLICQFFCLTSQLNYFVVFWHFSIHLHLLNKATPLKDKNQKIT